MDVHIILSFDDKKFIYWNILFLISIIFPWKIYEQQRQQIKEQAQVQKQQADQKRKAQQKLQAQQKRQVQQKRQSEQKQQRSNKSRKLPQLCALK